MPKKKAKYRSDVARSVHETVRDLHRIGVVDKKTMRRFDASCLTNVEQLTPKQIQALREREDVSQAVFASFLNVRPGLVSQWERGEKKPSGPSLKLLAIIKAKGLDAIA
jgi:putative transcriptional regulator